MALGDDDGDDDDDENLGGAGMNGEILPGTSMGHMISEYMYKFNDRCFVHEFTQHLQLPCLDSLMLYFFLVFGMSSCPPAPSYLSLLLQWWLTSLVHAEVATESVAS